MRSRRWLRRARVRARSTRPRVALHRRAPRSRNRRGAAPSVARILEAAVVGAAVAEIGGAEVGRKVVDNEGAGQIGQVRQVGDLHVDDSVATVRPEDRAYRATIWQAIA